MYDYYNFEEIFKAIVQAISDSYIEDCQSYIDFPAELNCFLLENERTTDMIKYPAFILQPTFRMNFDSKKYGYRVNAVIYIAVQADRNNRSNERYDNVYKTQLYPLASLLIRAFDKSPHIQKISSENKFNYSIQPLPFFGSNENNQGANEMPDNTDAVRIEIEFAVIRKLCSGDENGFDYTFNFSLS